MSKKLDVKEALHVNEWKWVMSRRFMKAKKKKPRGSCFEDDDPHNLFELNSLSGETKVQGKMFNPGRHPHLQ